MISVEIKTKEAINELSKLLHQLDLVCLKFAVKLAV